MTATDKAILSAVKLADPKNVMTFEAFDPSIPDTCPRFGPEDRIPKPARDKLNAMAGKLDALIKRVYQLDVVGERRMRMTREMVREVMQEVEAIRMAAPPEDL